MGCFLLVVGAELWRIKFEIFDPSVVDRMKMGEV